MSKCVYDLNSRANDPKMQFYEMNTFLISNRIGVAADPLEAPRRDLFTLIFESIWPAATEQHCVNTQLWL